MTNFIGSIQNFDTVVIKWIFDRNIMFVVPLTHDDMDYSCTNDDKTKVMNGYKKYWNILGYFQQKQLFRKNDSEIRFGVENVINK